MYRPGEEISDEMLGLLVIAGAHPPTVCFN